MVTSCVSVCALLLRCVPLGFCRDELAQGVTGAGQDTATGGRDTIRHALHEPGKHHGRREHPHRRCYRSS